MKKIIAVFAAAALIFAGASVLPQASVSSDAVIKASAAGASGKCGENATWVLDESGTFTVSGSGAMYDLDDPDTAKLLSTPEDFKSIKKIVISKGITSIGNYWFFSASEAVSVTLPDGLEKIGDYAFSGVDLVETLTIPDTVTSIGVYAFGNAGGALRARELKSLKLSKNLKTIGEGAFCDCEKLESLTIPNSVSEIGGYAFRGCRSLKEVTIPSNVSAVGEYAFWDCTSLKTVNISSGVKTIGESAFLEAPLESVTIPKSVTEIGDKAFGYIDEPTLGISIPGNIVIKGFTGTAAETYAKANGFEFVAAEDTAVPGDADGNGNVNIKDVMLIQQAIVGWKVDVNLDACDVNKDGKVDIRDVMLIQQAIVGWKVTLL